MRESEGNLLDVMGDHHEHGCLRGSGQDLEAQQQVFAGTEVEATGGLVEEEELGVGHEGAADEDALAFTLAQSSERPVREVLDPELAHDLVGPLEVLVVVLLVPAAEDGIRGGDDGVAHGLGRRNGVGHRRAGVADPGAEIEDVDAPELVTENSDLAR